MSDRVVDDSDATPSPWFCPHCEMWIGKKLDSCLNGHPRPDCRCTTTTSTLMTRGGSHNAIEFARSSGGWSVDESEGHRESVRYRRAGL